MAEASPVQACGGLALADLRLYDPPRDLEGRPIDWGAGIVRRWDVSEGAALQLLERFLATGLQHYEVRPALAHAGLGLPRGAGWAHAACALWGPVGRGCRSCAASAASRLRLVGRR